MQGHISYIHHVTLQKKKKKKKKEIIYVFYRRHLPYTYIHNTTLCEFVSTQPYIPSLDPLTFEKLMFRSFPLIWYVKDEEFTGIAL